MPLWKGLATNLPTTQKAMGCVAYLQIRGYTMSTVETVDGIHLRNTGGHFSLLLKLTWGSLPSTSLCIESTCGSDLFSKIERPGWAGRLHYTYSRAGINSESIWNSLDVFQLVVGSWQRPFALHAGHLPGSCSVSLEACSFSQLLSNTPQPPATVHQPACLAFCFHGLSSKCRNREMQEKRMQREALCSGEEREGRERKRQCWHLARLFCGWCQACCLGYKLNRPLRRRDLDMGEVDGQLPPLPPFLDSSSTCLWRLVYDSHTQLKIKPNGSIKSIWYRTTA